MAVEITKDKRLEYLLDNLQLAVELQTELRFIDGIDEKIKGLYKIQGENRIEELRGKIFELLDN